MKPNVVHSVCKQIAFGLHDLLKTNAANIHSLQDWFTLFTLLEVSGAGAHPPPIMEVSSKINVPESISDAGKFLSSHVLIHKLLIRVMKYACTPQVCGCC